MNERHLAPGKRWIKRWLAACRMERLDGRAMPRAGDELRLFSAVRNEELRLPYFLRYYFDLGVDRVFVVDNGSSDGTLPLLLAEERVHVFRTHEHCGRQEAWIDLLLRRHGRGHWCVVVDVDEILVYPHHPLLRLPDLCRYLDQAGHDAMEGFLLDMYPAGAVCDAAYDEGEDPLAVADHFDTDTYVQEPFVFHRCRTDRSFRYEGGMRRRVFGLMSCCTKFLLVRFRRGMFLSRGTHAVEGAAISDVRGALLHFKYLADCLPRSDYEARREAHWDQAREYKVYSARLRQDPMLTLSHPGSARYQGPEQLVALGLMSSPPALGAFCEAIR